LDAGGHFLAVDGERHLDGTGPDGGGFALSGGGGLVSEGLERRLGQGGGGGRDAGAFEEGTAGKPGAVFVLSLRVVHGSGPSLVRFGSASSAARRAGVRPLLQHLGGRL